MESTAESAGSTDAIIGGVVGGIVGGIILVTVAILAGILIFMRRKEKEASGKQQLAFKCSYYS